MKTANDYMLINALNDLVRRFNAWAERNKKFRMMRRQDKIRIRNQKAKPVLNYCQAAHCAMVIPDQTFLCESCRRAFAAWQSTFQD